MSHWRSSDFLLCLLVALAVWAVWEGYVLNHRPETRGCGGDFPQFYAAGKIVSQGEADRLYDQPYFRHLQDSLRDDPLRSLYPPTMGLLMAPLGRLPYNAALAAWWAIQAICILATGAIFYRTAPLSRPRRINMLVALAALLPLWIAVGIGHVAPLLLLVLAGGLTLHKQGKRCWAGLALSLLALKPQLAAGLLLWMLLRRDLRTLAGLAAGLIFQALAVAACLGATVWLDYLHALPVISAITRGYRYSPLFEQSFAGMARNLCWAAGRAQWQVPAMRMAYALTAGVAVVLLCRVVWARRPWDPAVADRRTENYEYACGALFMTIFPPYFLVYDQALLAVPLVMLWSSPAWRWGVALLAANTVFVANLSFPLGFSLSGLMALATMFAFPRTVPEVVT